jgi:putative membrane protein
LIEISSLPALNATLNAIATVFLITGYVLIRRGHRTLHQRCMIGALVASTAFLTSYVVYHYHVGSQPFQGRGAVRVVYLAILATHIPLAALIVPLALLTASRGLRSQFDKHVTIARWTLPLWLYVSVTGVVIYVMLYHL